MPLTLLKHFTSVLDAEMALGLLEDAGIKALLQKEGIPGSMGLTQGADLFVSDVHVERARVLLSV